MVSDEDFQWIDGYLKADDNHGHIYILYHMSGRASDSLGAFQDERFIPCLESLLNTPRRMVCLPRLPHPLFAEYHWLVATALGKQYKANGISKKLFLANIVFPIIDSELSALAVREKIHTEHGGIRWYQEVADKLFALHKLPVQDLIIET
jgi:hypothetical protein